MPRSGGVALPGGGGGGGARGGAAADGGAYSLSPFAVVEVHQGWCGPCKAIVGTFQRISIDMSDSPLKFYRANCDKVEQLGKYVGQCQPVFLFYKGGVVVEEVVGVDTPMLTSKIKSLV